ncbi:MAG TPA: DUF885 family protein [Steroidobacteraceae bacterium]|nr:DUF885 family protein [Steroidobacteraceae bacterium]
MSHDLGARQLLARLVLATVLSGVIGSAGAEEGAMAGNYGQLVKLFADWRAFERPPWRDGAPDYTAATFARRHEELKSYRDRLAAIDPAAWPVQQQVDYHLVRAEINGLDFYIDVLKPWVRDPAFYSSIYTEQSDTPAHEGPENHASIDLWTYTFPLDAAAQKRLASELRTIPPLLAQARLNLIGNARDLWIVGTGTMRKQATDLEALERKTGNAATEVKAALRDAHRATLDFVGWLDQQAPSKNGPSGIGKDAYTWSLRNVHLVPMTWEYEVTLLKRELSRAHAALRLEEQRNRGLPELKPVTSAEEYQQRANAAITKYVAFLRDRDIIAIESYTDPALRERIGEFSPEATRNFFAIASHLEPMTLFTHFYHWWDLAQMREEPHASPIRRGPLLFNIWDSRAEGMATAMEEMVLHAGYYDDNPRAREIVWIMLAQRAARGLGSLYAHANLFNMKEAKDFQVEWTPRGWMRPDLDLLGFEQQLYLRQPGYGTCYVTGKFLLDELMKDYSHRLREGFTVRRFFDDVNATGVIPVSLIRWQLTGRDDEIRALTGQLGKEYVHPR